jgi:O-antigen ligase
VIGVVVATTVGTAIALTMLGLYKPSIVHAAFDRVLSTGSETSVRNTSLGWRFEEASFAFRKIGTSPIIGIGLGTPYKPLIRMNGQFATESDEVLTRFIHNAYLGLWLKFGVLGPIVVGWLIWGVTKRGLKLVEVLADQRLRALAAATVAGFLVPTVTSFTQPEWLNQIGISFFALMLGLLIVTHRVVSPTGKLVSVQAVSTHTR